MFRENATLKHGLTGCQPAQRISKIEAPPAPPQPAPVVHVYTPEPAAAPAAPPSSPGTGAAVTTGHSLARTVAPYILTAAGAGGLVAGANYLFRDKPDVPPTLPPKVEVLPPGSDEGGSLLQYLQDQGMHLPEGTWPTNK